MHCNYEHFCSFREHLALQVDPGKYRAVSSKLCRILKALTKSWFVRQCRQVFTLWNCSARRSIAAA
jgi:hypothetical protein